MKNKKLWASGTVALSLILKTLLADVASAHGTKEHGRELKVCIEGNNPPYSYMGPSGDIGGFDYEIGKAIVEKMGREYKMVKMDWDGIIPALLGKKCDAIISSMGMTEKRREKIDFTDKYYGAPPIMFAGKKGKMTSDTPEALKGKTIAVQRGTFNEEYLKIKYPQVKIRSYASQVEANNDLVAGRVDAILQDVVPSKVFLESKEAKKAGLAFFGREHRDAKILGNGAGIGVRKGEKELRQALNKAIKDVVASGEYKKINDKYFDFDIYK